MIQYCILDDLLTLIIHHISHKIWFIQKNIMSVCQFTFILYLVILALVIKTSASVSFTRKFGANMNNSNVKTNLIN